MTDDGKLRELAERYLRDYSVGDFPEGETLEGVTDKLTRVIVEAIRDWLDRHMAIGGWRKGPPWDQIRAGHEIFLIRGHDDPESTAIPVKLVIASLRSPDVMAWESVTLGLSVSRGFDVVGDGNAFERRPLYECEGALWKKREATDKLRVPEASIISDPWKA